MDSPKNPPMTPGSGKMAKKKLNLQKLKEYYPEKDQIENLPYVLGISGGDCAGKKQLVQYMFDNRNQQWYIKGMNKVVAIVHQDYFIKDAQNKYSSKGTDWEKFQKVIRNLMVGNEVEIDLLKKQTKIKIKPASLLLIEGSHVFMEELPIVQYIASKIFIDSDADVRLSRRIYVDTQDKGMDLDSAISNYLSRIKPSYENEIQPCKIKSDIIIPHFGGGYDDHRKQKDKKHYESNIETARALILAHIKEQMVAHETSSLQ